MTSKDGIVNNRVGYYDIAKFFAIISVIYGHCIQHYLDKDPLYNPVYLFIYSFHMPLFMIISGYFSSNSLKLDLKSFIKKKSIQLLLPYCSWQLISVLIKFLLNDIDIESIVRYDFWFLMSLYICSIFAWFLCHIRRPYQILFLIGSIIITQVGLFRLKDMYPSFLLGLLLFRKEDWIKKYKRELTLSILLLCVVLLYFTLNEHFFEVGFTPEGLLRQVNIIVVGSGLSFLIIRLCEFLENKIPSLFLKLGQYTLGIYLVQSLLFTCTKEVVSFADITPVVTYFVIFPIITVLFVTISMFIITTIEKNNVLSLLLLGKRK